MDEVRREEVKSEPSLRDQRYGLLKDASDWTTRQATFMAGLRGSHLKTARAWSIKEAIRDIVRVKAGTAETHQGLLAVIAWAQRSRLALMVRFGRTLRKHLDGLTPS